MNGITVYEALILLEWLITAVGDAYKAGHGEIKLENLGNRHRDALKRLQELLDGAP